MKAWDIFEELGNLDEVPLLPVAPQKRRAKHGVLRIALIAAVVILLIGSALAVGLGVGVRYGKKTVYVQGVSLGAEQVELRYHTAELQYSLRPVEAKNSDLRIPLYFDSIRAVEEYFGLELMKSPQLESLVRNISVTIVESDGKASPDGLIFYLSLRRGEDLEAALDSRLVSESGITVFVALTEDFAKEQAVQYLYASEEAGKFRESGLLTKGGESLLLLETPNAGSLGRTGYAAWCDDGIAYLAHLKTYPDSYATPLSLLAPILEQVQ